MFRYLLVLVGLSFSISALSADFRSLKNIFESNYDSFYQPRFCGRNISRFVQEASNQKIDLTNAYVLKIVGAGFWETSAFSTRESPGDRVNLGRFHVILVADNHVFDFDLNEPVVLKFQDYIRRQFVPPTEPYYIFGNRYEASKELPYWEITAFEASDYIRGTETVLWKSTLGESAAKPSVKLLCSSL